MITYLEAMSLDEMMLELNKWEEPTPPEEEVLAQIYKAMYKQYISGWGYLKSDQVKGLV